MCERGDDEMIQMEYPKLPLDGLTPEEQVKALKRQVDILTDNLQIVLNSIEDDVGNVDNTSDKDKPISDAVQEALDEISEALDTKVDKVTGKGLSTNDYTTSAKDKVDGIEAYVVESGTSNGWNYKKYSDGTIEAWSYRSTTLSHYSNPITGLYGYSWANIPTPFTMSGTAYTIEAEWKIGNGFSISGGVGSKTTSAFQLLGLGTASGSNSVTVTLHLFGS